MGAPGEVEAEAGLKGVQGRGQGAPGGVEGAPQEGLAKGEAKPQGLLPAKALPEKLLQVGSLVGQEEGLPGHLGGGEDGKKPLKGLGHAPVLVKGKGVALGQGKGEVGRGVRPHAPILTPFCQNEKERAPPCPIRPGPPPHPLPPLPRKPPPLTWSWRRGTCPGRTWSTWPPRSGCPCSSCPETTGRSGSWRRGGGSGPGVW